MAGTSHPFGEAHTYRSVADITDAESLDRVRAFKQEMKARAKAAAGTAPVKKAAAKKAAPTKKPAVAKKKAPTGSVAATGKTAARRTAAAGTGKR